MYICRNLVGMGRPFLTTKLEFLKIQTVFAWKIKGLRWKTDLASQDSNTTLHKISREICYCQRRRENEKIIKRARIRKEGQKDGKKLGPHQIPTKAKKTPQVWHGQRVILRITMTFFYLWHAGISCNRLTLPLLSIINTHLFGINTKINI